MSLDFNKFINSAEGYNFLSYLKRINFNLWQKLANSERKIKCLSLKEKEKLSEYLDIYRDKYNILEQVKIEIYPVRKKYLSRRFISSFSNGVYKKPSGVLAKARSKLKSLWSGVTTRAKKPTQKPEDLSLSPSQQRKAFKKMSEKPARWEAYKSAQLGAGKNISDSQIEQADCVHKPDTPTFNFYRGIAEVCDRVKENFALANTGSWKILAGEKTAQEYLDLHTENILGERTEFLLSQNMSSARLKKLAAEDKEKARRLINQEVTYKDEFKDSFFVSNRFGKNFVAPALTGTGRGITNLADFTSNYLTQTPESVKSAVCLPGLYPDETLDCLLASPGHFLHKTTTSKKIEIASEAGVYLGLLALNNTEFVNLLKNLNSSTSLVPAVDLSKLQRIRELMRTGLKTAVNTYKGMGRGEITQVYSASEGSAGLVARAQSIIDFPLPVSSSVGSSLRIPPPFLERLSGVAYINANPENLTSFGRLGLASAAVRTGEEVHLAMSRPILLLEPTRTPHLKVARATGPSEPQPPEPGASEVKLAVGDDSSAKQHTSRPPDPTQKVWRTGVPEKSLGSRALDKRRGLKDVEKARARQQIGEVDEPPTEAKPIKGEALAGSITSEATPSSKGFLASKGFQRLTERGWADVDIDAGHASRQSKKSLIRSLEETACRRKYEDYYFTEPDFVNLRKFSKNNLLLVHFIINAIDKQRLFNDKIRIMGYFVSELRTRLATEKKEAVSFLRNTKEELEQIRRHRAVQPPKAPSKAPLLTRAQVNLLNRLENTESLSSSRSLCNIIEKLGVRDHFEAIEVYNYYLEHGRLPESRLPKLPVSPFESEFMSLYARGWNLQRISRFLGKSEEVAWGMWRKLSEKIVPNDDYTSDICDLEGLVNSPPVQAAFKYYLETGEIIPHSELPEPIGFKKFTALLEEGIPQEKIASRLNIDLSEVEFLTSQHRQLLLKSMDNFILNAQLKITVPSRREGLKLLNPQELAQLRYELDELSNYRSMALFQLPTKGGRGKMWQTEYAQIQQKCSGLAVDIIKRREEIAQFRIKGKEIPPELERKIPLPEISIVSSEERESLVLQRYIAVIETIVTRRLGPGEGLLAEGLSDKLERLNLSALRDFEEYLRKHPGAAKAVAKDPIRFGLTNKIFTKEQISPPKSSVGVGAEGTEHPREVGGKGVHEDKTPGGVRASAKQHTFRPPDPTQKARGTDVLEEGLDSSHAPRGPQRRGFSDGFTAVRRSGRLQETAVTKKSLRTTTNVSEMKIILEHGSESQREALLDNPKVPENIKIQIRQKLSSETEASKAQKETKISPEPLEPPVEAFEPSPASEWLLKPLSEFETEVVLSPEELAFLRDTIGEGKKVEWAHLEKVFEQTVPDLKKISGFDPIKLSVRLTPIAEKLGLKGPAKLILEYKAGRLLAGKKMPVCYKVLKYLLENSQEVVKLDKMNLSQAAKGLAKKLNEKPESVWSAVTRLRYLFREFGENCFLNIRQEYKFFCKTGKLPKKWLYFNNVIPEHSALVKLLDYLAKLSPEELTRLKKLSTAQISEQLKDVLGENPTTLQRRLDQLKRGTGAEDITQLAEQAKIVVEGGEIHRPPVSLTNIVREDSPSAKLLNYLAKLSETESTEFKELSDRQISELLRDVLGENPEVLRKSLGELKRITGAKDITQLTEQAKIVVKGGKIERPPASLADIIGEDSIPAKLLNYLAELSEEELIKFKKLDNKQIGELLEVSLGENPVALEVSLGELKRCFRERDIIELVKKYKELKEKGKIFGFNFYQDSSLV